MTMSLRDHCLFQGIDAEALDWLDQRAQRHEFEPDVVLIRQGEVGSEVYLILEGEVDLYREDSGMRLNLGTLTVGGYFGYCTSGIEDPG